MSDYFVGTDILGADFGTTLASALQPMPAANVDPNGPYITIHINNVAELARSQGGVTGGVAASIVPKTVELTAYNKMMAEFATKFREKGVNADIRLMYNKPKGTSFPQDFLVGSAVGASAVGVIFALLKLVHNFTGRK